MKYNFSDPLPCPRILKMIRRNKWFNPPVKGGSTTILLEVTNHIKKGLIHAWTTAPRCGRPASAGPIKKYNFCSPPWDHSNPTTPTSTTLPSDWWGTPCIHSPGTPQHSSPWSPTAQSMRSSTKKVKKIHNGSLTFNFNLNPLNPLEGSPSISRATGTGKRPGRWISGRQQLRGRKSSTKIKRGGGVKISYTVIEPLNVIFFR